jgi:hypothetical protein
VYSEGLGLGEVRRSRPHHRVENLGGILANSRPYAVILFFK